MKRKWMRTVGLLALLLATVEQGAVRARQSTGPYAPQSHPIIADSLFVYGPAVHTFNTRAFFAEHTQAISTYSEIAEPLGSDVPHSEPGVKLSAPDIVEYAAHHYSLNPQLLLSLLELKSGFLTGDKSDSDSFRYAMEHRESGHEGLVLQLDWAARNLTEYFYSYPNNPVVTFTGGTTATLATDLNAGTFALLKFLAIDATQEQWLVETGDGPGSFSNVYKLFFGDPLLDVGVAEQAMLEPTLKLPLGCSEDWIYSNGPHAPPLGPAIDFAPMVSGCSTSTKKVVAAADGVVVYKLNYEVVLDHDMDGNRGTGLTTQYYHLRDVQVNMGDTVQAGAHLGYPSCQGGSATGTHLHFGFGYNGAWVSAVGQLLSGWTINSDGSMTKPGETTRYPSIYWSGRPNHFVSDNCSTPSDTTPPTINFTSYPPLNQWYNTNQRIDWSVSDSSGVWGFSQAWDNPPSGPPPQFPGATSGWLDFSGLGQGQHTARVRAWDNSAGHNEASAQLGWFGYDTLPPLNPTSVSPGCNAPNNVWQNTCNDLSFAWSGTSDGNGSGVKNYHYYWGESSSGVPDTYTSAGGFDPPPVAGPVAVRYLRLSTRDNLNQESPPSALFVLRYDVSVPIVTLQINHGAITTTQASVLLNLSAGDTGSGVYQARVSNNGLAWTDWQPYAADTALWTLPALDRRTLTIYVQVRDRAGNESAVASDSITLDLYPPAPHSVNYRICADVVDAGGSVGLASTGYRLTSAIGQPWATGGENPVSSGFLASITGCLPISHAVTTNYTVTRWVVASGGNLRGSANYRLGDTTGQPAASSTNAFTSANYSLSSGFWAQITSTVPPTTTLPPVPPTLTPTVPPPPPPTPTLQPGGFGVSIEDGALYTNDPAVTVHVWAPDVTHVRLSNDSGYSDQDWRAYQITTTWVLSTHEDYGMPRTVYAWFRDATSSVYGPYSDDIIYDPVPPEGQVSILGSETITVSLWLEAWDDNSGVDRMRVAGGLGGIGVAAWQPYTSTLEWVLTGDVVYAQFQDRAANISSIYGSDGSAWETVRQVYLPLVVRNR